MNEEEFKSRVERRWGRHSRRRGKGRIGTGIFLLAIGVLLLAKAAGVFFPDWFFTWPVLLIGIGIVSGIRHRFRTGGWPIPLFIGSVFLADRLVGHFALRPYIWPVALIAGGLFIMLRPKCSNRRRDHHDDDTYDAPLTTADETTTATDQTKWEQAMNDGKDIVDITAVFGGVKKNILSKNFKGGDVTAIMGGAELNLTQADFTGKVMIDNFNMFGGTKLIVPPDWDVQSGIVAIFGGVEDKRPPSLTVNPGKVLYLDGTCIFGGVEIKSY